VAVRWDVYVEVGQPGRLSAARVAGRVQGTPDLQAAIAV
jgi:hypothetical protein